MNKAEQYLRRCCHLAMFVQAMVINLVPLLFVPLRELYGLDFEQLGRLVLVNFLTQMLVDLVCTAVVDRFGLVRPLTIAAQFLAAAGLVLFALSPTCFGANVYTGFLAGTILYSAGCGLIEVLVSPIVQALPTDRKEQEMAFLHAFYPVGKTMVVVITGGLLWLFGPGGWIWISLGWAFVPLVNMFGFLTAQIPDVLHSSERQRTRSLFRGRLFPLACIALLLAGAAEVTMAQWTPAFAQVALALPQPVADCVGFGLFGVMMIVGRLWFGLREGTARLEPLLMLGALGTGICYLLAAHSTNAILALTACVLSGLFVSLLWPGIVSLTARAFPLAGISMFALLAAFGDCGAGAGPWMVGWLADNSGGQPASGEGSGLRLGLFAASGAAFLYSSSPIGIWFWRTDSKMQGIADEALIPKRTTDIRGAHGGGGGVA